jgi:hypothetical protein
VLVIAVGVEILLLGLLLFLEPLASLLGQAPPTAIGWVVAMLAAPAVLLADAAHKRVLGLRRRATIQDAAPA